MTLEVAVVDVLRNLPVIGSTLLILWLSLPQLAERFAIIAKLLGPFSKRARQRAQVARDTAERDRQQLLADAQAVAQTTATNATTQALLVVNEQAANCQRELRGLREITGDIVDVLEDLLPMLPAEYRPRARDAIRRARIAM